jgi:hypothetical protein
MNSKNDNYSIRLSTLGLIIGTFAVGYVTACLVNNKNQNESISLSTMGLVNFVISILLSTSSLVLAVVAINLSKSSEKAMTDRSDESIKLQNEVFSKTIEALGRIESSTGVTEKRIEDIISGRAGAIADRLLSDRIVHRGDKQMLEEEIKASLRAEINQNSSIEKQRRDEEDKKLREEAWQKYVAYKEKILIEFTNIPDSKALRISDGKFGGQNEELLDGLFLLNGKKIGVCTFSGEKIISHNFLRSELDEFINKLAIQISKKTFDIVLLIFDEESETTERYRQTLDRIKSLMKSEIADKIVLITSKVEELKDRIQQNFA